MPTYEYECYDCHTHFEEFQSITAPPADTCPKCGGHNIHRLITGGAGLIFKGSGFYITDYARHNSVSGNGKNGKGKKETPSTSKTDKKSEKTESKPSEKK